MWDESLAGFLAHCRGQGSAERSVDFYSRWIRAFAEWCASRGVQNLSDVTPSVVTAWRDDCLHRIRHSVGTVRVRQKVIVSFLRYCTQEGLTAEFPAHLRIKTPKAKKPSPRWLDDRTADRILRVAEQRGTRDAAMVSLLLLSGLRVGEAVALRVGDVALRVDATSWITVHAGKGMKTRRVPVPGRGRLNLERWIQESGVQGFLFPGRYGRGHLSTKAAAAALGKVGLQAGSREPVTPHQLRHTLAHRLLEKGVPLQRVAEILGHSSLDTTKMYVTASDEELAADISRAWD